MTPPKLPDFLSESGFTTLLPEKRGQLRTRISAILKSRKELARSALPDAVNRAEGAFMTPALYPAPRSQGGRGRSFGHNADPRPLSESRRQRPTAAQTAQGVSQPHPSSEKPTQGEGPPKSKGFGSLIQRVTPSRNYASETASCLSLWSLGLGFLILGVSTEGGASASLQM